VQLAKYSVFDGFRRSTLYVIFALLFDCIAGPAYAGLPKRIPRGAAIPGRCLDEIPMCR